MACVPAVPWIEVDPASGELRYVTGQHAVGAGLSGEYDGMQGGQCISTAEQVDGEVVKAAFAVLKVFVWQKMCWAVPG